MIVKLKKVADIKISSVDKKFKKDEKPVKLCNYVDVYKNTNIYSCLELMDATATQKEISGLRLRKNDVLITKDSETANDIGMSACVATDFMDNIVVLGYHVALIRPKDGLDGKYLNYLLHCDFERKYMENNASGSGQRVSLSQATLDNIPVLLKDLSQQKLISDILFKFDQLVKINQVVIDLASLTIKQLYNYWFVQFDFPDENGRPYKSSGGKMVYNEQLKQEIPDGWECKKLTDLFNFVRGTEVGSDAYADKKISDDYIHFWRVRDVGDDCKTWVDGNMGNLTIVKPGDVVITLDGTVGKIGINLDGAISGGLRHAVDHTSTISSVAIYAILQSDYVQESLRQYVRGRGSILAHASGALQHLAIPYDKDIFNMFQDIIQPMFDLMVNCKEESKQLASLRDWLLPMLMNGQVKIGEQSKQPHTDRSIERTENDK